MTSAIVQVQTRLGALRVQGPLKGYHHEAYAVKLPADIARRIGFRWVKLLDPRPDLFWFDMRCFPSQDVLLQALYQQVTHIPEVVRLEGFTFHHFIEGRTLGRHRRAATSNDILGQVSELFRSMVAVPLETLPEERSCDRRDWPGPGDSGGFLRRLATFTHREVYGPHREEFAGIFHALGVREDALENLSQATHPLHPRPFSLLHGDLHRKNFIVDGYGQMWTIDWELAMVGDPLYDLATHLHLMRYPARQQAIVMKLWRDAVEQARPGASAGMADDLDRYLAYKQVQSVYTDILREGRKLKAEKSPNPLRLLRTGARIHDALERARTALSLAEVPSAWRIMSVFADWHRAQTGARDASVPV